jgi:SNF2 family DNA or RNA helicase
MGAPQLYVNSPMNAEIEEELPEPPSLEVTLLPHQRQALWWLNKQEKNPLVKGGILADAMGTNFSWWRCVHLLLLDQRLCALCFGLSFSGVGKTIEMLSLVLHTIAEQRAFVEQVQRRPHTSKIQVKTLLSGAEDIVTPETSLCT